MKHIIYLILAGILILASFLALLFYYNQNFSEELNIYKSVEYKSINFQTNERNSVTYLSSADAIIGDLKLQNKGYFTQKYFVPKLFGCLTINEAGNQRKLKLEVQFITDTNNKEAYQNYYDNTEMNIRVGETKDLKLKASFNDWNTPLSAFSKDNIQNLEIYKIPKKESNPLGNNYNIGYYDCSNLQDLKPIANIQLN